MARSPWIGKLPWAGKLPWKGGLWRAGVGPDRLTRADAIVLGVLAVVTVLAVLLLPEPDGTVLRLLVATVLGVAAAVVAGLFAYKGMRDRS